MTRFTSRFSSTWRAPLGHSISTRSILRACASAEVQPKIALRHVAAAAAHFIHLGAAARRHADPRADGAAVRPHAFQLQDDPVSGRLAGQFQQRRHFVLIVDHDFHGAIVIEVAEGRAARGVALENGRAGMFGNIFESPIAQIAVEDAPLFIVECRY